MLLNRNLILSAMTVVALANANMAYGQKTFQPTDGIWHDNDNWSPVGTPGPSDTAIIPNGKTCRIASHLPRTGPAADGSPSHTALSHRRPASYNRKNERGGAKGRGAAAGRACR